MSDPQQPPLPPYGSNEPQPAQPAGYPAQPAAPAQQPHAQPVYAQPEYSPSAPARPTDSNPMGRIGLIFGILGIKRVGAPHAVAGIATGLGIAIVVGAGLNFVFNAISMMMAF